MPRNGTSSARRSGVRNAAVLIDSYQKGSALRRAKITGGVAAGVAGLLSFMIASSITADPVDGSAVMVALVAAAVGGIATFGIVVAWPVLRVLWHWAGELVLLAVLLGIYVPLAVSVSGLLALVVVVLLCGVPWLVPVSRRFLRSWGMCMVVRHRVRVAADAFIEGKGVHGAVAPLILWARPTEAGERVWLWLRGDLTLSDLEDRLAPLASTCWAREATVQKAGNGSKAAYVVVDLYRSDPLVDVIEPEFLSQIPDEDASTVIGEVVDRQGVTLDEAADVEARDKLAEALNTKVKKNGKPSEKAKKDETVVLDANGDDISEWI